MKLLLKLISFAGLILTVIPSFFVFTNSITLYTDQLLMLLGTVIWFVSAPSWMNKVKG